MDRGLQRRDRGKKKKIQNKNCLVPSVHFHNESQWATKIYIEPDNANEQNITKQNASSQNY